MGRDPASDGVEHLQRAAHELIAAARSFLDAAEGLVDDRDLMSEAGGALRSLARDLAGGGSSRRPFGEGDFDDDGDDDTDHDPSCREGMRAQRNGDGTNRVRRIDVE